MTFSQNFMQIKVLCYKMNTDKFWKAEKFNQISVFVWRAWNEISFFYSQFEIEF